MKKLSSASKMRDQRQGRAASKSEHKATIKATLERLDGLGPETAKAAGLIVLLRSWLNDESGYDERTWPKLMKALDEARDRVGARRLFDG